MNYTTLANGAPVHGLSAGHMLQYTNVLPVLAEALATIDPTGLPRFSKHTIDLGRPIGIMEGGWLRARCPIHTNPASKGSER